MRRLRNAGRTRLFAAAAGIVIAGGAVAAVMMPARAAVSPVTVTNPGTQTTSPLGSEVDLPIAAADSDLTGGALTYTSTALPAGLTINAATGEITGIATTPFDGPVTVTATDTKAATGAATFTWIVKNTIAVTNPDAQTTAVNGVVSLPIVATDNGVGATLAYVATGLPAGLAIDPATGVISGTVTTVGKSTVTVTASDGTASPAEAVTFGWAVTGKVTVTAPAAEQSLAGVTIKPVTITATDTVLPATYTFSEIGLPKGLQINVATGTITGTPTAAPATYATQVIATDKTGGSGTATIQWTIGKQNVIKVAAPATKLVYLGVKMTLQLSATDSVTTEKTFSWTAKGLPAGLAISKAGLISGRPAKAGLVKATVTAADSTGSMGVATISWNAVSAVSIINLNPKLKSTTVGQGLHIQFSSKDAVAHDTQAFSATGLPPGMFLSQKPLMLWGWPSKSGGYTALIHEKGSLGTSAVTKVPLSVKAATGKGAAGRLILVLDSKCLQSPRGSKVEITNCVAGATEQWTLAADGTLRARGGCLDISGSSGYSGKAVVLAACNGSVRQKWTQGSKDLLVNPASGLCLTDPGASRQNGVVPKMGSCKATSSEQWETPPQPVLSSAGGFCADDFHSLGYNNSTVDLFGCNGTQGQNWYFGADGTIRQEQYPQVCLTVHGTLGKAGVKVTLWKCQQGDKQQLWSIAQAGGLGSEITLGGVCLSIPSLTSNNGTPLVTGKCGKTNPLALWHIW